MKKRFIALALIIISVCVSCSFSEQYESDNAFEKTRLSPGDVFEAGSYIEIENVEILYNGKTFEVTNNESETVIVSPSIVAMNSDGSYDEFYFPTFHGVDVKQYEEDMNENGWAIEKQTNVVRPGEVLNATIEIYKTEWCEPDPDGDGYYDILFTVHPQTSNGDVQVSTSDPKTDVYKLKA